MEKFISTFNTAFWLNNVPTKNNKNNSQPKVSELGIN